MAGERFVIAGGGTGGHLVPALNLAAALGRADASARVTVVGAERGIEARVLPESGLSWSLLPMEPLRRSRPWRNWRVAATAPRVLGGLRRLFRDVAPDVVVGTGGYASGPVVLYGILTGRATALQEQNAQPGLVTRWLAPRVDRVYLGYPEAAGRLRPGRRTVVHAWGNPVAPPTAGAPDPEEFRWPAGRVVAVIGGSQGARGLNERLLRDLEASDRWPEGVSLVWVAGPAHHAAVADRVERLPVAPRIRVVPWVPDLGRRLTGLTLAIGRAGAMFCAELAAAGVPAVLVPFPAAAADHQRRNAAALADAGAAVLREEERLRDGELWETVTSLLADESRRAAMSRAMAERGRPEAADRIARDLVELAATGGRRSGGRRVEGAAPAEGADRG
ncbi:MAG: UDP-N-acetylglucosamine--N-acetylmuramyl-(pentapeptide) pyrophosphoryl-undecaprenol N-acetylglucosamine transferase [Gemmatimonadota bacterium]|nr:UDP-N-acetylglucosamine--N-acetylmuramyl-(pentapeptide) pyrophosphoryl-undecaprenol N-acetylglucosamine transferase [Gemmatimonadota bacterium]